jgi:hypothetical protein
MVLCSSKNKPKKRQNSPVVPYMDISRTQTDHRSRSQHWVTVGQGQLTLNAIEGFIESGARLGSQRSGTCNDLGSFPAQSYVPSR